MSRAQHLFWLLIGTGVLLAALLLAATARLMHVTMDPEASSPPLLVVRWCLEFLTGSPALDELVLVGLLGVLPLSLLLGGASLVRQWLLTRRALRPLAADRRTTPHPEQTAMFERLEVADRVDIVVTDEALAFCHGLLRPRICISTGLLRLLTAPQLEAVLIHERHHLRNHDPLRVWITRAVSQALFFMPVAADLRVRFLAAKELAADSAVIQAQGSSYPLASALYRLVAASPSGAPTAAVARLVDDVDIRIDHLVDPGRQPRFPLSARTVITSLVVPILAIAVITHPGVAEITAHAHATTGDSHNFCLA